MFAISVLMWKHLTVRRYSCLTTIAQLILSILFPVQLYVANVKGIVTVRETITNFTKQINKVLPPELLDKISNPGMTPEDLERLKNQLKKGAQNIPEEQRDKFQQGKLPINIPGGFPGDDFRRNAGDNGDYRKNYSFIHRSRVERFVVSSDDFPKPLRVVYGPRSRAVDALMADAGARLGLPSLTHIPTDMETGFAPFDSEEELAAFTRRMGRSDAVVLFQNEVSSPQDTLGYTIQMKIDFDPEPLKIMNYEERRRSELSTAATVRLQWALDSSHLQMLTGVRVNQTLRLVFVKDVLASKDYLAPYICLVVGYSSTIGHFLTFLFLVIGLLGEKKTGIQEFLRLNGVPLHTVLVSHVLNVFLIPGLVYFVLGTVFLKIGKIPLIIETNWALIFIALLLHYVVIMTFGIFVAGYVTAENRQSLIVLSIYILLTVTCWFISGRRLMFNPSAWFRGLMPPHGGLFYFLAVTAQGEKFGEALSFGAALPAYVIMILQSAIFFSAGILGFYLFPGKYGEGLSLRAILQKIRKKKPPSTDMGPEDAPNPAYFEALPNQPVGIKIVDITMAFPNFVALKKVNLDVLEGEITVLLGHNGAGKTTLMHIITGLLTPTSGHVLVKGMDTRKHIGNVRKHLGLCTQHNLYYRDLTVTEHYQFFAMLKGKPCCKTRAMSAALLKRLNLTSKANALVDQLSGGMKRRVQLACALAGDASVLILDEPTSGLDIETRRELWDILLEMRGERTVLLTTHFMEEADALGDRIAGLHLGRVKCFAPPMFLKRAIGSGYKLTLTTLEEVDEPKLTAAVQQTLPGATAVDRMNKSVTFNLPGQDSAALVGLFAALEKNMTQLGIASMGVSQSTLDDVFMKLCTDINVDEFDTSKTGGRIDTAAYKKHNAFVVLLVQFWMLFQRQCSYLWSRKFSFIVMQLILPITFSCMIANSVKSAPQTKEGGLAGILKTLGFPVDLDKMMNLGIGNIGKRRAGGGGIDPGGYSDHGPEGGSAVGPDYHSSLPVFKSHFEDFEFRSVPKFSEDIYMDDEFIVGIHLNNTHATAMYTDAGALSAPAAVSLLTNRLAAQLTGNPRFVRTIIDYQPEEKETEDLAYPKQGLFINILCIYCVIYAMMQISSNVALPAAERVAGTRHLLQMCGVPPLLFWSVTYFVQVFFNFLTVMLPIVILAPALDEDGTFNSCAFVWALSVLVLLTLMASCALNSLFSMCQSESSATTWTLAMAVLFTLIGLLDTFVLSVYASDYGVYWLFEASVLLAPAHAAVAGARRVAEVAQLNAWCAANRRRCPGLFIKSMDYFDDKECCEYSSGAYKSYFDMDSTSAGGEMVFLFLQFLFYSAIVLLMDTQIMDRLLGAKAAPMKSRFHDSAILEEKQYVEEQIQLGPKNMKDSVLAYKVYKKYVSRGVGFLAVKGINFSVAKGECFGLLGVNGAGKTTTFRVLNAEELASRGRVFSKGYSPNFLRRYKYMESFSYCGQFQGLDTFLTGRQNLLLVLRLRGLKKADATAVANSWLDELGLMKYADRRVSAYSGGCARRLSAAAALCQRAGTTLLDEPTAGVDPVARRRVQAAVVRAKRAGDSVIIASHNMDEMETLCERMLILSGGQVAALGAAPALRLEHAQGFSVVFKFYANVVPAPPPRSHDDEGDTGDTGVVCECKAQIEKVEKAKKEKEERAKKGKKGNKEEKEQKEEQKEEEKKNTEKATTSSGNSDLDTLKQEMMNQFKCEIIDDRSVMIQYRIYNDMRLSELFYAMENAKKSFPNLIEDYSVSMTTLEEVFLHFAKEAIVYQEKLKEKIKVKKREPFFQKWCKKKVRVD